jgi:hypothetical protein
MFKNFYMAGFECATGQNMHRVALDQVAATGHDVNADEDYARLRDVGIQSVREASRWGQVDRGGRYDFGPLEPFIQAARRHRMELVWDLFHYGYPADLDLFSAEFPARLARYAAAVARHIARELPGPHYLTPINEPSYFAWAAGEVGCFAPHLTGRGYELKVMLVRAQLAAVRAVRDACPAARIVTVDPICHVVPPPSASAEDRARAHDFNHQVVFQFMDMVSGRSRPELGGSRDALGIVGLNYYWTNQWELDHAGTALAPDDPRRRPLAALLRRAARRYGGDLLISETAAVGDARPAWIHELSRTALELLAEGVRLRGVCLYPVLGMPEWHDQGQWTQMGLWDVLPGAGLARVPHEPSLQALAVARQRLRAYLNAADPEERDREAAFASKNEREQDA